MDADLKPLHTATETVVAAVHRFPGSTCAELIDLAHLGTDQTVLALVTASRVGQLRKGPARFCHCKKVRADTWWPVDTESSSS